MTSQEANTAGDSGTAPHLPHNAAKAHVCGRLLDWVLRGRACISTKSAHGGILSSEQLGSAPPFRTAKTHTSTLLLQVPLVPVFLKHG